MTMVNKSGEGVIVGANALTDYPHQPGLITEQQEQHLAQLGQWCPLWFAWDPTQGKDRSTGKVPITPGTNVWASVKDPTTARTLDVALASIPKGGGVGPLVSSGRKGLVGIDVDNVVHGNDIHPMGVEVIGYFKCVYVELSPSGTGLRIFCTGVLPDGTPKGSISMGQSHHGEPIKFEMYGAGGPGRFLRTTGATIQSTVGVIGPCPTGIAWMSAAMIAAKSKPGGGAGLDKCSASTNDLTVDAVFEALADLRPEVEPEGVLAGMLRDTQTATTVGARQLKQALKSNKAGFGGDQSALDFFLFAEAVRRGCGSVECVRVVVESTAAKRDKWDELRNGLQYLELTAGNAATAVLKELQGKAAKRKRVAVDPAAVKEMEAAGAVFTRNQRDHIQAGFANIVEVLRIDTEAKGLFAYDLFKGRMYRTAPLTALDLKGETEIGPVTDDDYRRVALFLHRKYGLKAKLDDVRDAVKTVARDEKFDPVRASLEKLGAEWDKKERLSEWLVRYMKIDESVGTEYVRSVSRACLIQAVRRVFEPGARAETMPVFVGPGGEGKGKAFQALANAVGPGLFTNGGFDISKTSDIVEKCRGRLIVEASELDCVKRTRDVSAFKAAMSVAEDTHRKPWESESEDFKRTFTIWGSSNEDEFITDASNGQARRVWPLFTMATQADPIDIFGIEQVGGQLWGEAVAAYLSGELSYFDAITAQIATKQWIEVIERCRIPDPLDDSLNEYLMQWAMDAETWRSSTAISIAMGLQGAISGKTEKRDFHALAELLKARKMVKKTVGRTRGWVFSSSARAEYRSLAIQANMTPSAPHNVGKTKKELTFTGETKTPH